MEEENVEIQVKTRNKEKKNFFQQLSMP
uniref:Uncharacterized protein n=1 Tax=Rhizophora mucronata TaxID=61149 RepID=A0A2P2P2K4_RHIMU